jgi:hypothetical protein
MAKQLKEARLTWQPAPGDRFASPDRDLDEEPYAAALLLLVAAGR